METVYEIIVYLHEGENVSLGLYASERSATLAHSEACEEWTGPNVARVKVVPRKVQP